MQADTEKEYPFAVWGEAVESRNEGVNGIEFGQSLYQLSLDLLALGVLRSSDSLSAPVLRVF